MSDSILETRGLTKAFGGLVALDKVDLTIESDKITAVIGPNGAGKTTLFNLIAGVYAPTAGKILFRGRPLSGEATQKRARLALWSGGIWSGLIGGLLGGLLAGYFSEPYIGILLGCLAGGLLGGIYLAGIIGRLAFFMNSNTIPAFSRVRLLLFIAGLWSGALGSLMSGLWGYATDDPYTGGLLGGLAGGLLGGIYVGKMLGDLLFSSTPNVATPYQRANLGIVRTFQHVHLFGNMSVLENVMTGQHPRSHYGFLEAALRLPKSYREEEAISLKAMRYLNLVRERRLWLNF